MASAEERPDRKGGGPSGASAKAANADEIQERYLRRAIAEINELDDEPRPGRRAARPVLGSAIRSATCSSSSITPTQNEIHEGVAFFGRAGQAPQVAAATRRRPARRVRDELASSSAPRTPAEARRWLTRELHTRPAPARGRDGRPIVAFLAELDFHSRSRSTPTAWASSSGSPRRSRRS